METMYDSFKKHGYSRRDFLKFATSIAVYLSLSPIASAKLIKDLETKPKPTVIWLEMQDCAGCSESFIRSSNILPSQILFDLINLKYHETLMAPAGERAEEAKEEVIKDKKGEYILIVEGSISNSLNGAFCMIGGKSNFELLKEAAKDAGAIISVGSCASWGGLPHANPNPTGATSVLDALGEEYKSKLINIPGCPPIADVMVSVIIQYLTTNKVPKLDNLNRPLAFYSQSIHDSCYRRGFYNATKYVKSFDDEGARSGHCLYELGCKGPITRNACSTIRWNGGLSFPIQSGHPCFGCSEPNFWDNGHIYEPLSAPSIDSSKKDVAYISAIGVATGVVAGAISKFRAKKSSKKEEQNG